jgi:hypothetical protein
MYSILSFLPIILGVFVIIAVVGIIAFISNVKSNNMDHQKIGSAKDFFLQLGAVVSFYASVIALITLLFEAINYAYPKVTGAYYYYFPSISLQVATLIVAFPLFIFLSWMLQKSYQAEPLLRESLVRRWLAYITVFIAGAVVAGDLITVIYMYLDGQELTTGFLLKVLALLVIAGGVFLYYLREIRNVIASGERNVWRAVAAILVVGSIILGFSVVGSPADQRALRYDNQRVSDLQNIQWQIVNFYQQKGFIPSSLTELEDPISGFRAPTDPATGEQYGYTLIGQSAKAFELCATFQRPTPPMAGGGVGWGGAPMMPMREIAVSSSYPAIRGQDNWDHEAGRKCFERAIDPQLYPVIKR